LVGPAGLFRAWGDDPPLFFGGTAVRRRLFDIATPSFSGERCSEQANAGCD
jgi:hypothetical protein